MIIQHNKSALNAHRQLDKTGGSISKNLEKLSSGLKINRAGDDAAGLAISEKMRGQIRGVMMGSQNIDMGINLVQTAEGGLQEVHAIMQRMRELAVQSSNGTYAEEDRQAIQKEIAALTSEINRLSTSVNYNTMPMFDGSITGDYEYHYGIKGPNTTTPTTPASVTAGESFVAPVEICAGNASIDTGSHLTNEKPYNTYPAPYNQQPAYAYSSSNLLALDSTSPNFPVEGLFVIQVATNSGTVNAVLDFADANSLGSFTLADFEDFFADKFKDVADFKIEAGHIVIESLGSGGPGEKIEIGKTDLSVADLKAALGYDPGADIRYVNSSLFDTRAYTYQRGDSGAISGATLTTADWAAFKASGMNMDTPLPDQENNKSMWALMPDSLTITFQLMRYDGSGNASEVATYSIEKGASGASSYSEFLQAVNNLAPNEHFSAMSVSPTAYVDRDGNAYVQFNVFATKAPAYNSSSYFYNTVTFPDIDHNMYTGTGYGPASSAHVAESEFLPTITSAYTVPNPLPTSGELTVTIGNVPGTNTSRSVTVNFGMASPTFTDAASLAKYIQDKLNESEPDPKPIFVYDSPDSTYNSSTPIATVTIDASGKLVVTAQERRFTITIDESMVNAPMYAKHPAIDAGSNLTNYLVIEDNFGTIDEIPLFTGNYQNIDDFISKNASSFMPYYILSKSSDGKSLVITTSDGGAEYTIRNISFKVSPHSTDDYKKMQEAFTKLGFDSYSIINGTTSPAIPEASRALWIQGGANTGEGMFIAIPRLDAYDLGLMIKLYDVINSGSYNGISKELGTDAYTDEPNIEPRPMGFSLDVTTPEKASAAIPIMDNAINIVSSERAQLGAAQNRLESMARYNDIQGENLQASESGIRDLDLAKETMEFTKNGILSQAAQSMLAQSNQLPQNVLSLIKQ